MIFVASLLYVLTLFVVPGEIALMALARFLMPLPYVISLTILNVSVYLALLFVVKMSKMAYEGFQFTREAKHRLVREYLDVRGCRWLNFAGVALIGSGAVVLLIHFALPVPFWFLFGAIVIGFLDIFSRDQIIDWPQELPAPRFVPTEQDAPLVPKPTEEVKEIQLDWDFRERGTAGSRIHHSKQFVLRQAAYQEARERARFPQRPVSQYARYAREGVPLDIERVAEALRQLSCERGYSTLQEVENIVAMVRSIAYATDEQTHGVPEYANFPIETLYEHDQGGDCEDHAILAAALLRLMGHDVALFHLELSDEDHLALGYHTTHTSGVFGSRSDEGKTYFYIETVPTDPDDRLGDISDQFLNDLEKSTVVPV